MYRHMPISGKTGIPSLTLSISQAPDVSSMEARRRVLRERQVSKNRRLAISREHSGKRLRTLRGVSGDSVELKASRASSRSANF